MQEVVRKQIMPDTTLTYVKTDKFKTCCLSVNLITKLDREAAAKNALLPRVLLRGTSTYPDMESVNNHLDELYGARVIQWCGKKVKCTVSVSDRFRRRRFCTQGRKHTRKNDVPRRRAAPVAEYARGPAAVGIRRQRKEKSHRRYTRRHQRQKALQYRQAV